LDKIKEGNGNTYSNIKKMIFLPSFGEAEVFKVGVQLFDNNDEMMEKKESKNILFKYLHFVSLWYMKFKCFPNNNNFSQLNDLNNDNPNHWEVPYGTRIIILTSIFLSTFSQYKTLLSLENYNNKKFNESLKDNDFQSDFSNFLNNSIRWCKEKENIITKHIIIGIGFMSQSQIKSNPNQNSHIDCSPNQFGFTVINPCVVELPGNFKDALNFTVREQMKYSYNYGSILPHKMHGIYIPKSKVLGSEILSILKSNNGYNSVIIDSIHRVQAYSKTNQHY
jgi:hypothetical protein